MLTGNAVATRVAPRPTNATPSRRNIRQIQPTSRLMAIATAYSSRGGNASTSIVMATWPAAR